MVIVRESRLQGVAPPRRRLTGPTTQRRTGGVYRGSGSELFVIHLPGARSARWGPPVVWCHAALGSGNETTPAPASRYVRELTNVGLPVICADLGGPVTWGNDDSIDAVGDALAYATSAFGVPSTRVALFGVSMGGTTMTNWAARNISRVSFMYGMVPVLNTQAFINNPANAGSVQSIYDAYGGTQAAWLAAAPTHDPVSDSIAKVLAALGDRLRIDADINDSLILNADYEPFLAKAPDADLRWFPGNHFTAAFRDPVEVARWAHGMAMTYG